MLAPAKPRPRPRPRIAELDALRGLAVIGIACMNVFAFALPLQAYYNPDVWGPGIGEVSQTDRIVWAIGFVFIEDKFRTLFAMLFGAGCLILIEGTAQRTWRKHLVRMFVLFLIGLAHSVFLASNDILRAYALAGLALPLLAPLSHRALYAIAIGFVAVHVGGGIVAFGSGVVDFYAGRLGSDASLFAERNFGRDAAAINYSLELGSEDFLERVARRTASIPAQVWALAASIPINLAAMSLGMALWKDRMLAREWRLFRMQRLAAICAILSVPPLFVLVWWVSLNQFPGALVGAASLILSAPFDTLLALAYAALAMAFFSKSGRITQLLAQVGRLSLTNYLMTSLIFAAIFASWGGGLFGEVSRYQAFAIALMPITAMFVFSPLWVRFVGQGPAERLWRRLTRLA